jgi:hypothetical protein
MSTRHTPQCNPIECNHGPCASSSLPSCLTRAHKRVLARPVHDVNAIAHCDGASDTSDRAGHKCALGEDGHAALCDGDVGRCSAQERNNNVGVARGGNLGVLEGG